MTLTLLAVLFFFPLVILTLVFCVGYIVIGSALDAWRVARVAKYEAKWGAWEDEAVGVVRQQWKIGERSARLVLMELDVDPHSYPSVDEYLKAVLQAAHRYRAEQRA